MSKVKFSVKRNMQNEFRLVFILKLEYSHSYHTAVWHHQRRTLAILIFQSQWYSDPGKNDQDCHNDPNIMIMRKWIVMFAFRRKIGSFLLIYGYAPVPTLYRSIKITFNPNEHCPGRCILCTWIFDIIPNFVGFQHLGSRQKQIIAHSVLEHLETIFKQSMH